MKILNINFIDRFITMTIMLFTICVIYAIPNFITVEFEVSMVCLFGLALISMHLGFAFSCMCEIIKFSIKMFKKLVK